jgi:secreted trypsin-like serine protease
MNGISSFVVTLLVLACALQTVMAEDPKIINGYFAAKGDFPFIVQLFNKTANYNFCGGSLIGSYHVLTAAHCVHGVSAAEVYIWAGSLNLYDGNGYSVNVQNIYVHASYNPTTIRNDIAVIKLEKPFPKSVGLRTVKLPTTSAAVGATVTASGFGSIVAAGGTYPEDLMYVSIPIISASACTNYFGSLIVANQMVCAFNSFNQGTCYGDSGGPVVTGSKVNAVQQGVVSFGSSAGCATAPSVFARVSYFRNWILTQTVHTVTTGCVSCAVDTAWKGLCQHLTGTWALTANSYQCKNLNFDKTRINLAAAAYSWAGCTNNKARDLCEKVGRYTCTNNRGTCNVL